MHQSVDPKVINVNDSNSRQGIDQVEIGAFKIQLKNGREFYDIHTSYEVEGIKEEVIGASLKKLLKVNGIEMNNVAVLEYYHTHPWGNFANQPLSGFDANFIKEWLLPKIKTMVDGKAPAVNLYAIALTVDSHIYLYQSSY